MQEFIESLTFSKEGKNYIAFIFYDEHAQQPSEWIEFLGKIVTYPLRNYTIGEELDNEEMEKLKKDGTKIKMPLYMHEHSGIALNTCGFGDPWDSGQIGYIYADRGAIREEYGVKRVSKKILKDVQRIFNSEIEILEQYINGEVYGFRTFLVKEGINPEDISCPEDSALTEVSSCWGYYGLDDYIRQDCFACIE